MKGVRFLSLKNLLGFAALTGVVHILNLINYFSGVNPYDSQTSHGLGRQIASIDEDSSRYYANVAGYGHLEMLNSDFKETLERYSTSVSTLGEEFKQASLTSREGVVSKRFREGILTRCSDSPFLLIEIHSKPDNFVSREAIRLSWGSPDNGINRGSWSKPERTWKTVFLVGKSKNSRINHLVQQEALLYNDVIIGDFPDTFRHLARKMLLSIAWPLKNCPSKYILKTDEDCFINIIPLMFWLNDFHKTNGDKNVYMGKVQKKVLVQRDEHNRYYVSRQHHSGKFFNPYISGGGYLFSGHLLARLFNASKEVPVFPVEDASFGLLMRHIGVTPRRDTRFLPFVNCERSYETLFERPMCHFKDPFVVHGVSGEQQIYMHHNVLLMNFMPTICSYIDNQSEDNHFSRIC